MEQKQFHLCMVTQFGSKRKGVFFESINIGNTPSTTPKFLESKITYLRMRLLLNKLFQEDACTILCEEGNEAWKMSKTSGLNPPALSYLNQIT